MKHAELSMENIALQPHILIIEDEPGPRDALKMILRPFFRLHTAESAEGALQILRAHPIELVTLDLKLPDRHGVDLLREIKTDYPNVEVVIITGYGSFKSAMEGIKYGAAAYLLKPFNVTDLITVITQTLEKKHRLAQLRVLMAELLPLWQREDTSAQAWARLIEFSGGSADILPASLPRLGDYTSLAPLLSDLLEAKNRDLFNHSCRVGFYATLVGKYLRLSAAEQQTLAIGASLHDIGVIGLEQVSVGKTFSGLTEDPEWIKRHTELGARLILSLQLPAEIGQIIAYHHEWYDGTGYPHGLRGEGIPLLARIVAIAQAFDHFVFHQSMRSASTVIDEALGMIGGLSGTRFDPELCRVFSAVLTEHKASLPLFSALSQPSPFA
jgi:putative nucleotidyltransferase with HDIG domain